MIQFSKMHGLGNDFVVIDAIHQDVSLSTEQIQQLADRHFGIGFDQLLLVKKPQSNVDFRYEIFNADGSEVAQCGNGARCFAIFVSQKGLTDKKEIQVETATGELVLYIEENQQVRVDMGVPQLMPEYIPFIAEQQDIVYEVDVAGTIVELAAVSMGNPHAVIEVSDIDRAAVATLGPRLENHERFPERVNVGFCQIVSSSNIKLRVFERGSGETLACGSGACAAVVAGILQQKLQSPVSVTLPGGELVISWQGEGSPVLMTGPASFVFDGMIEL